jgi:hypothetical protein
MPIDENMYIANVVPPGLHMHNRKAAESVLMCSSRTSGDRHRTRTFDRHGTTEHSKPSLEKRQSANRNQTRPFGSRLLLRTHYRKGLSLAGRRGITTVYNPHSPSMTWTINNERSQKKAAGSLQKS